MSIMLSIWDKSQDLGDLLWEGWKLTKSILISIYCFCLGFEKCLHLLIWGFGLFYFLGKVCLQLHEYTSMKPQPCPSHVTPTQLWARMQSTQSKNIIDFNPAKQFLMQTRRMTVQRAQKGSGPDSTSTWSKNSPSVLEWPLLKRHW